MNQQDVERWIEQNGGPKGVQYNRSKKRLPNPAYGANLASGAENPNWDPLAPQFIEVEEESWVNSKTGATLRVNRGQDGGFDVIENKSGDPNKKPDTETPEAKNAAELQRQREKNAALPPDQDPAYETDKERRDRAEARIKEQGTTARADEAKGKKTYGAPYKNKDGVWLRPWTDAAGNRGTEEVPPGEIPQETTTPQGVLIDSKTEIQEGKEVTVETYELPNGKTRTVTKAKTDETKTVPAPPTSATGWQPDLTKPDLGIQDRAKQLVDLENKGVITKAQRGEILTQDRIAAKLVADNTANIAATQRGVYGDQVRQRSDDISASNAATSFAGSTFNQSLSTAGSLNEMIQPGSDAGGKGFLAMLDIAREHAKAAGGLQQPAQVQLPPWLSEIMKMNPLQAAAAMTVGNAVAGQTPAAAGPLTTGISPQNWPGMLGPSPEGTKVNGPEWMGAMMAPPDYDQTGINNTIAMSGALDDDMQEQLIGPRSGIPTLA